jgi:hypothetical protein
MVSTMRVLVDYCQATPQTTIPQRVAVSYKHIPFNRGCKSEVMLRREPNATLDTDDHPSPSFLTVLVGWHTYILTLPLEVRAKSTTTPSRLKMMTIGLAGVYFMV